jgi:hypothetical protein
VTGLLRYHAALLIRSYRWVAPALVFAVVVVSATAGGSPAADAFGFAGAVLVPACAWLVRVAATVEPGSARACVGAAGGTWRAQLSALLVVAGAGMALGLLSVPVVLLTAARDGVTDRPEPSTGLALAAGLLGQLACVLVGVAVGALCNPPVLRIPAAVVLASGLFVVVALVSPVSPASAAIRAVIGGEGEPSRLPLVELASASLMAAVAVTASVLVARSRGVD